MLADMHPGRHPSDPEFFIMLFEPRPRGVTDVKQANKSIIWFLHVYGISVDPFFNPYTNRLHRRDWLDGNILVLAGRGGCIQKFRKRDIRDFSLAFRRYASYFLPFHIHRHLRVDPALYATEPVTVKPLHSNFVGNDELNCILDYCLLATLETLSTLSHQFAKLLHRRTYYRLLRILAPVVVNATGLDGFLDLLDSTQGAIFGEAALFVLLGEYHELRKLDVAVPCGSAFPVHRWLSSIGFYRTSITCRESETRYTYFRTLNGLQVTVFESDSDSFIAPVLGTRNSALTTCITPSYMLSFYTELTAKRRTIICGDELTMPSPMLDFGVPWGKAEDLSDEHAVIRFPAIAVHADQCADRFYVLFMNQKKTLEPVNTVFADFMRLHFPRCSLYDSSLPKYFDDINAATSWKGGIVVVAATGNSLVDFNTLYVTRFADLMFGYMYLNAPSSIISKLQVKNPLPSSPDIVIPRNVRSIKLHDDVLLYLLDQCGYSTLANLSTTSRQFSSFFGSIYSRYIERNLSPFLGSASVLPSFLGLLREFSAAVYGEVVTAILQRTISKSLVLRIAVPYGTRLFFEAWFGRLGFVRSEEHDPMAFDTPIKVYQGPGVSVSDLFGTLS
ncbi:hypothetical protein ONZ45_g17912 [Pleurotus djamor]|nr:hypothetical protein ONZ45_g17912 [Pleurotus djamor]